MSMVGIATRFLGIFTVCKFAFVIWCFFCESSVLLSWYLVLFRNNSVSTLIVCDLISVFCISVPVLLFLCTLKHFSLCLWTSCLAGDLYNEAAEEAMAAMKGRLANKYFALAEEAWALSEDWLFYTNILCNNLVAKRGTSYSTEKTLPRFSEQFLYILD